MGVASKPVGSPLRAEVNDGIEGASNVTCNCDIAVVPGGDCDRCHGTLCHEVSHTIHHDTVTLMERQARLEKREVGALVLTGPTRAHVLAVAVIGKLHSLGYSRDVESRADLTGSDICADAGYNPWGLVWLFRDFSNARASQVPQLLSNHPEDKHRIAALEKHFRDNPSSFEKFSADPKTAQPISVPKDAPEVFLR